ncbi:hypothetical protein [Saccharothrix syringae]|uniref:Uncharacterized protein n=1 Tax=Saccharothrix syringae TaxID=103733 RepID=A0A5Q0HB42_SACSY|nr:hypothetical protein [Saccharothrix syringae]QFZ23030.1 hypothetical protein EKG83_41355 [Saccharothrix syringae]
MEATVANGTFVARIEYPSDFTAPADPDVGDLVAFDAAGTEPARYRGADLTHPTRCWASPAGVVVHGRHETDPAKCEPARPRR